ncbi:MAG: flippase [Spirochaetaceae bacterium]|nr:flippase [Spirochaetaceae bacterium]
MKNATSGRRGSILGNFLYSSLTTLLNVLVPLATYPYLARVLGPDNMGRLGVAGSFANYFIVAAGLGFATYGVRSIAAARRDRTDLNRRSTELFVIAAAADLLASIAYFAAILAVPRYREDFGLFALFGVTVVATPAAIDWYFRGIEEFRFIGLRNAAIQIAYVAALFAVVHRPEDTTAYAGLLAAVAVAGAAANLWTARRYASLETKGLRPRSHLAPMGVFALLSFAITAYTNLDFLFLGLVSPSREAGLYSISLRLVRMVTTVTATLSGVLLPRLSLLAGSDEEEFKRIIKTSASAILLFSLPAAAGVFAVSEDLALLFGGSLFSESATSLRILAAMIPVVACSNFLQMQFLIPRGRERALLVSFGVGLAVTGAAMALLVKPYGQIGAAWGMLAGEAAVLAAQAFLCGRAELRSVVDPRRLAGYVLGSVACGGGATLPRAFMDAGPARLATSVFAGCLLYSAFLFAVREPLAAELSGRILSRRGKGRA